MKFMLGFISGYAVGHLVASNMTPEQRAKASAAASRVTQRVGRSPVARSLSDNASQVTGAASERVAGAVDSVGDSLTDRIADDRVASSTSS